MIKSFSQQRTTRLTRHVLRASVFNNWTIVRPAITNSKYRYQLITLEANIVIYRALNNLPLFLPKEAMHIQGTMSWAGDVAKMLSRLVLNPSALKETYTLATAKHHTWEEIANNYKDLIGLEYIPVDTKTYLEFFNCSDGAIYQLLYDRCFNRIIDNSIILKATGLKQSELTPLKVGLERELSELLKDTAWSKSEINEKKLMLLLKLIVLVTLSFL